MKTDFNRITFFDEASALSRISDEEEFCTRLAYHDRFLVEEVKSIVSFLEDFLNPSDIRKSSDFSQGVEGFSGKVILKSGDNTIRVYAKIDSKGQAFIKIGVNDAVKIFTDKDSLASSLAAFASRVWSAPENKS